MILEKEPVEGAKQTEKLLTEKRKSILLSLLITGLFFMLLSVRYDFYYDLNDDTAIRDILSGIHSGSPSAYSIQMLYPLSWMLSMLYRLMPSLPWFGLFLNACQVVCVFLIGDRVSRLVKKWQAGIATWIVFLLLLSSTLLYQFIFIQYTVVCGMLMVAAAFRFGTEQLLEESKKIDIVSVILMVFAFQLRTEMSLMLMPFIGLILFCRWIRQGNLFSPKNLKKAYSGFVISLVLMAVCYLVNAAAYRGEDWKKFMEFFEQRTTLYDFIGVPKYEDNQDFYEMNGLSKEEYRLLENYNFSLDDEWNNDSFAKLIAYRKTQAGKESSQPIYCYAGTYTTENLNGAIWSYKQRILYNQSGVWYYVILASYVCLFMMAVLQKKYVVLAEMFLLLAGRSAIWLYLIVRNRMPERILMPLYLMEFVVLLVWLLECFYNFSEKQSNTERVKTWWAVGIGLILVTAAGGYIKTTCQRVQQEYARRESCNQEWDALRAYCKEREQNYYLLDVYSTTAYSEKIYKNVDNSFRNYDLCGGWLAKSPLTREKLAHYQIENPETALVDREGIYFIASIDKDITWLQEYYSGKDYRVNVEKCDTIADSDGVEQFAVYQVSNVIDRKA